MKSKFGKSRRPNCGWFSVVVLLLFSHLTLPALCQGKLVFSDRTINVVGQSELLYDANSALTPEEAMASEAFMPIEGEVANLGVSPGSHWVRFSIDNSSAKENLIADIAWPIIDEVDVYKVSDGGPPIPLFHSGGEYPLRRIYDHQDYIFPLGLEPGESATYLIRVQAGEQVLLPIKVGESSSIFVSLLRRDLISALYFGIILVMFLYNLFIWFTVRDRSYLYYVVYIFFVGLTPAVLQGYAYQYLWPDWAWLEERSVYLCGAAVGVASMFFQRNFLNTKVTVPRLDKVYWFLTGAYVITVVLTLSGQYNLSYQMIDIIAVTVSLFMLVVTIVVLRRGYRQARFFLAAWTIFLVSVVLHVLKDYGVLPYNNFTTHLLQIGSAVEIILLAFGLADRINAMKRDKEKSQADTVAALEDNERIIRNQNEMLEREVKVRTGELMDSNQELSLTLHRLKQAQTQLVNAEKMASLGQLTAGIAHEINNPINFVASNVKPLRRDLEDIFTVLDGYGRLGEAAEIAEAVKAMEALKEELEVDYLKTEIDQLLSGIEEGASRTAEIIRGLKNFSRLDEGDIQTVDIHEGLDSTLTLLQSSMRGKVEVIKDYGDLPMIECYGGKVNQVFMNVISNAVQAIFETAEDGIIIIMTRREGDGVGISIKDNGPGMSEETQHKIFEPFFTTKEVGKGTGLGLSIVFSIIESHGGSVHVTSEVGEGTEFLIHLPSSPIKIHSDEKA